MRWFWILWIFNLLIGLVPVGFFLIGMSDGTVNANNMGMWAVLLAVVALLIGGTYWLKQQNQVKAAKIILAIAAIPSIFAMIFVAILVFGDVRWN